VPPTGQREITIGPFKLDRRSRTLVRGGDKPLVLGGRALDVLVILAESEGETVLKSELLERAWADVTVEENNLQVQISVLRRAMGDGWIVTVPGVGYRLMTTSQERSDRSAHERSTGRPSIVVLPFASLGGTARRQLFADGIAEEIITTLSRLSPFFVISRNSSFTYRNRAVDVRQLAHDFGVRYVLEGAVRWSGRHIRVTTQLTDAEVGSTIWADRYDGDLSDILGVQDEISQAVVEALGPAISAAERKRAIARAPESLGAWEAYQRALWHWSQLDTGSLASARRLFKKAVALDERFAQAHAMLAYMHLSDVTRGLHPQPDESLQLAEDEARAAIALDPDNSSGHATLAWTFTHQGRMGLAREEAELAVSLGPSDPWAHVSRGHVLAYGGKPVEAIEALATTLRLDPFGPTTPIALHHLGVSYYLQRDYIAAEATARRTVSIFPHFPRPHMILAAALGQLGRRDEAERALEAAVAISPKYLSNVTEGRMRHYRPENLEHVLEGLRKAGWQASLSNVSATPSVSTWVSSRVSSSPSNKSGRETKTSRPASW